MTYSHLINQVTKRLSNPLPGHGSHPSQKNIKTNGTLTPTQNKSILKPAAVLIVLFPKDQSLHFFLTKRTDNMEHHKSQISFPGGAKETGESLQDTALRETTEELGVQLGPESIIGKLTPFTIPISGYHVHPFIAWCDFIPIVKPDPAEVEKVFALALNSLQDSSIYHTEKRQYNGTIYNAPYFQFSDGKVWGATAMILAELKYILRDTK